MYRLNREEREIRNSVEKGEWKSVRQTGKELQKYIQYARDTLRKNRRLNIRLPQSDLEAIRIKAIQEGIPYQTLIASVLHKYVAGRLRAA